MENPSPFDRIATRDGRMQLLFELCRDIAPSRHPVLLTGETGVGKELFAQAIHAASGVPGKLVALNIAGLDDMLFADAVFGHVRGAFTGAAADRKGALASAAAGTLFLDEIGDLSPLSQIKLLRLLQNREYSPLGSDEIRSSDARILLATHRDLPRMMREGAFREDLFYRVSTHRVEIPPLRERRGDLPLLLDRLLRQAAEEQSAERVPFYPGELLEMLKHYHFPGNVRELESMVYDAFSRCRSGVLPLEPFLERIRLTAEKPETPPGCRCSLACCLAQLPLLPGKKEVNDLLTQEAMRRASGNQSGAARLLGITPQAISSSLRRKVTDCCPYSGKEAEKGSAAIAFEPTACQ